MKFGPVLVEQAAGTILGRNISAVDGRRGLLDDQPERPMPRSSI